MKPSRKYRTVVRYKDYFDKFFAAQRTKVKEKIIWTLELVEDLEMVPERYLKHVTDTDGLYEVRVKSRTDIFQIFCFFDVDKLVILMNVFQKKSQKTPRSQIDQAIKIKSEYEREKK